MVDTVGLVEARKRQGRANEVSEIKAGFPKLYPPLFLFNSNIFICSDYLLRNLVRVELLFPEISVKKTKCKESY